MSDLATLEQQITQADQQSFLVIGEALSKIKEGALYSGQYQDFNSYCRERWRWSKHRAKQLIAVYRRLPKIQADISVIKSEGVAREVISMPQQLQTALVQLLETIPGKVTASAIKTLASVLQEAIDTGTVEIGDDGQLPIVDALKYQVTETIYESYLRQKAYIDAKQKSELISELIGSLDGVQIKDIICEVLSIKSTDQVTVKVWKNGVKVSLVVARQDDNK